MNEGDQRATEQKSVENQTGIIADAEHLPLLTDETASKIASNLDATLSKHGQDATTGHDISWVLEAKGLRIVLTSNRLLAPRSSSADSIECFYDFGKGLRLPVADMAGITRVEADPDNPTFVRFVQESDKHWGMLIVDRDGRFSFRLHLKAFR